MNKEKTLESVANARKSHLSQMSKIEAAINGKSIEDPTVPDKTKCAFGAWLYADKNHLRDILGALFFENIEVLHAKWHSEYQRIFEILFKTEKKGFFSKILGTSKIDEMEIDRVKLYYSELKTTTDELLKALASSERRLNALNESKFNS